MGFRRSLIKTSRNNYVVTVPKGWVDVIKIKYGNVKYIDIDVNEDDSLVLRPVIER